MTTFNREPYFDDFNELDNFYKVLHRPGAAVQARELNNTSSILQNQITRFGDWAFENGNTVLPGSISINNTVIYINIEEPIATLSKFKDKIISVPYSENNEIKLKVLDTSACDCVTQYKEISTLYCQFEYEDGSEITDAENTALLKKLQKTYVANVIVKAEDNMGVSEDFSSQLLPVFNNILSINLSCVVDLQEGIFYIDGYFVRVPELHLYTGRFTNTPTTSVGFQVDDIIQTSRDNQKLLDNATGEPGFAAPGAHRYKIDVKLIDVDVASPPQNINYIELLRLKNGAIEQKIENASYSHLQQTFARRTNEESGSYEVKQFQLEKKNYSDQFEPEEGVNADEHFAIGVSPGKAYVKGYEIDSVSTRYFSFDKARDTNPEDTDVNDTISPQIGNYITVTNLISEIPAPGTEIDLHSTLGPIGKIGKANFRFIEKISTGTESGADGSNNNIYRVGLYNIVMNANRTFEADVKIIRREATGALDFQAHLVLEDNMANLIEPNYNISLFYTNKDYVKSISNIDYNKIEKSRSILATGGDISAVFEGVISADKSKLIILNDSSNDVENVPDSAITFTFNPTNTEVTITGLTSTSNYIVYADVRKLGETPRTKTKSTITDSNVSLTNRMYSLTKSDIIRITEVKYSGTTNTIPINSFRLDNGQRDNTYELGFLVPLRGAGGGGNIDITYEYFAHGASGDYFSALSYASVDYADIPTYIRNRQDGGKEEIRLSDVLDFRKPYNATEPNLPVIGSRIDINAIVYYLPRIDLLSLDSTGNFVITKGEPSLSPSVSPSPVESMDLATIEIEPYTLSVEDNVHITTKDNRRYTMADIGRIDRRVTNNEYYLSLTLLEKETEALTIRGSDNLDRFKHGFIVDNFRGHGIGDVTDEEYRISIDQDNNELRPMHDALQASPIASRAVTDNVKLHDNGVVTLDYVDEVYVENLLSSRDIDINPYKLASYNSPIILVPNSDIWKDQVPRPSLNVNLEGISDAIARVATSAGVVGTQWNQWNTNWFGRSQTSSNTFSNASTNADTSITTRTFRRTLSTQRGSQTRSGLRTTAVAGAVRSSDFVVDVSYIEFIRPRPVVFYASNLKPNQKYHLFFDEVRQTDNVIPATQIQIQEIANTPSRNINPREYNTVRGVYQEAFDKPDSKVITNTTHTRSNGGQVNITTMNTVINNPNQMTVLVNSSNITLVGNHVLFYGFSRSNNISLQDSNIDWWSNNLFNISASNRSRYSRSFSGSNPFEAINLKIYKMIAKSGNTLTLETLDGSDALPDVDNTDLTAYNGNQSTNTKGRLYRLQASGVLCLESPAYDFSNTNSRYISEQTPIIPNQRNYHLVNVRNGFGIGEVLDVQGSNRITVIDDLTTKMLTSDYNSISVGTYFIPQGQFKTGERKLKLTDNYSNSDDAFDSISYGDYTAVGLRQETAEISTRPINFRQERVTQNRPTSRNFSSTSLVSSVTRGGIPPAPPPPPPGRAPTRTQNNNFDFTQRGDGPGGNGGGPGGHDPLSQTIYISEETGIMVSKLDLYFNSVGTRPIIVEIRTTQNGIPTYLALPESVVTISPNKVNLPVNNSNPVATTITFPSPVFLKGLETYAITIKTDEPGTTLFVSEIGQQDIRTRNPIARQPSTGSLYISQNSREFQIFQNLDLTFKLYKANFYDTYEGSIEVPFATDSRKLDESPFQIIVNGNKRYLKVFSMNHGGMVDSEITFYTDSTVLNDDLYSIIYNSVHKISDFDLDNDYFHIDLGESTGSRLTIDTNQDGIPVNGVDDTWYVYIDQPDIPTERIGSDNIISMTGIPTADLILLKSNDVIFKETSVNYSYTHDNQTGFKTITQGANTPLSQRENLHNFTVRMLLRRNEPTPLVNTDNISPVVDLTEISEILVRNIISNDSNPSKATYITRPLVLANTADSLRVFFDANIPSGTSIRLSYATSDTTSDLGARNAVGDRLIEWTDLNFTNEIINETNEFSERTINRESIPPYSNLQIRIEMFSNNFVQVPRLKNLRLIAYS